MARRLEVVARALHYGGRRRPQPFVAVNCGALPEGLIESELFGHELGAFAGALRRRVGHVERAHNGSLFLDAVDCMPLGVQVKMLRVLEEREIHPIGSDAPRTVDLRVLASSSEDLNGAVIDGRMLLESPWHGNIRELSHFAQRFALGLEGRDGQSDGEPDMGLSERVAIFERRILRDTLEAHAGDVAQALLHLKIPRKTFYDKLKRHGLKPGDFRGSEAPRPPSPL